MKRILAKRTPVYFTIILSIISGIIIFSLYSVYRDVLGKEVALAGSQADNCPDDMRLIRSNDYELVKPLFLTDIPEESGSSELKSLRSNIELMIQDKKQRGEINSASVYIREMNTGEWVSINNDEVYYPASLLKVAVLITYLKENELHPGLLDKEWFIDKLPVVNATQQFPAAQNIVAGRSYKIRELIERMMFYSDNYAALTLDNNMNIERFTNIFLQLGMPKPDFADPSYQITTAEFSRLMRILYSASYLSNDNSEYALSLLTKTDFRQGLLKDIPQTVAVSHKFGEYGWMSPNGMEMQLHESGIVYVNNNPYLITIMTKGKEIHKLPNVLSDISRLTFQKLSSNL